MVTTERLEGGAIVMRASGTLTKGDYETCVPELERALKEGKLRVLVIADELKGWTPSGLVEELKFDVRHHADFEKVGVVGDQKMVEWGTKLSKPFFSGEVKTFRESELEAAMSWIQG